MATKGTRGTAATRYLASLFEIVDAFVDVGVDGVIRLCEIAGIEECLPHVLCVFATNGISENRQQIIDAELRRFHQFGVVERVVKKTLSHACGKDVMQCDLLYDTWHATNYLLIGPGGLVIVRVTAANEHPISEEAKRFVAAFEVDDGCHPLP